MDTSEKVLNHVAQALLALLLASLVLTGWLAGGTSAAPWPFALVLGLAVASTLISQARSSPLQNILVISGIVLVIAGIVQAVNAMTSIPFGPLVFTDNFGDQLSGKLPWAGPLLWVVILLNCRGVARLILRPWRKLRTYGFRVIGLTCLLVALFDLGLEPFAARANHFWLWQVSENSFNWFGAPWFNFLGWAMTALLILGFTTPWLINKQPGKRRAADFHPLIVWLALNLFLATTLALHQLWLPAEITLAVAVAGTISAWRYAT